MSRMVEGIGLFFQQVYIAIDINPFDLDFYVHSIWYSNIEKWHYWDTIKEKAFKNYRPI